MTDLDFCAQHGANCGTVIDFDNCGTSRQVVCGSCVLPESCSVSGIANVCGQGGADVGYDTGDASSDASDVVVEHDQSGDADADASISTDPRAQPLAAGKSHTCVILSDGDVWCWGLNEEGQLGDGTNVNATRPVPVSGRV